MSRQSSPSASESSDSTTSFEVKFATNITPASYPPSLSSLEPTPALLDVPLKAADGTEIEVLTNLDTAQKSNTVQRRLRNRQKNGDTTHVPRPANAFIIFRRYYTNNVHKPGTVDTSKSTLSRIIGEAWNALDPEQRKPFDDAAKREKAAHALKHPEYQFKPIHSKRPKKNERNATPAYDDDYQEYTKLKPSRLAAPAPSGTRRRGRPATRHEASPYPSRSPLSSRDVSRDPTPAPPGTLYPATTTLPATFHAPAPQPYVPYQHTLPSGLGRRPSSVPPAQNFGFSQPQQYNNSFFPITVPSLPMMPLGMPPLSDALDLATKDISPRRSRPSFGFSGNLAGYDIQMDEAPTSQGLLGYDQMRNSLSEGHDPLNTFNSIPLSVRRPSAEWQPQWSSPLAPLPLQPRQKGPHEDVVFTNPFSQSSDTASSSNPSPHSLASQLAPSQLDLISPLDNISVSSTTAPTSNNAHSLSNMLTYDAPVHANALDIRGLDLSTGPMDMGRERRLSSMLGFKTTSHHHELYHQGLRHEGILPEMPAHEADIDMSQYLHDTSMTVGM